MDTKSGLKDSDSCNNIYVIFVFFIYIFSNVELSLMMDKITIFFFLNKDNVTFFTFGTITKYAAFTLINTSRKTG